MSNLLGYLLGILTTISLCLVSIIFILTKRLSIKPPRVIARQSTMHEVLKPLLPLAEIVKKPKNRQSTKHEEKTNIKVIIIGREAYWVKDNIFYMADMSRDGIDKDTTRIVDTINMDKVQLDKMLFIMDQLREGKTDDSSSTGNQ